jgi:hypothetical protein
MSCSSALLVASQTISDNSDIYYRALRLGQSWKTFKWRAPLLYGELPASVTTPPSCQGHLAVTFQYNVYRAISVLQSYLCVVTIIRKTTGI